MEIYINNNSVSFELETEKNALEIVSGITIYAASLEPKQYISSIYINDVEYSLADEESMRNIENSSIKVIEVITNDIMGLSLLSLSQINRYLYQVKTLFELNQSSDIINDLPDSISWMKNGIDQVVSLFGDRGLYSKEKGLILEDLFNKLFDYYNKHLKVLPADSKNIDEVSIIITEISSEIDSLSAIINSISNSKISREDIQSMVNELISGIDQIKLKLPEVTVMFQSGKDIEGMDVISQLSSVLDSLLKVFNVIRNNSDINIDSLFSDNKNIETFIEEINKILKELLDAINRNDFVMIGDLLEYEFMPCLETARESLYIFYELNKKSL